MKGSKQSGLALCDALEAWLRSSGATLTIDRDWFPVEISVEPLGYTGRDKVTVAFAVMPRRVAGDAVNALVRDGRLNDD